MENKDKANGKKTLDCRWTAFIQYRAQMAPKIVVLIFTNSSSNFEHDLHLRCKLPLNSK